MSVLKQTIKATALGLLAANGWWIACGVCVLVVALALFSQIDGCHSKREARKTAEQKQEIQTTKGQVEQIEEQRNEVKHDIKQAEILTNSATVDLSRELGTDSGARDAPAPPPAPSGVSSTAQTPNVSQNDDDELAQMLRQSISEANAAIALAELRLAEIVKKDLLLALDEKEIAKQKRIIEVSELLIARLEKQCRTTTFFFVIKFKRC